MRRSTKRGISVSSHKMLRDHGVEDSSSLSMMNSIPLCCKMWFPCVETSGTVLTDVVGGLELTPSYISFGQQYAVTCAHPEGAPSAGSIPAVDYNDDFIMLAVYRMNQWAWSLVEGHFALGEQNGQAVAIADSDAFTIKDATGEIVATDTWARSNVDLGRQGLAIVKSGGKIGLWKKCLDGTGTGTGNTQMYVDGQTEVWSIYRKLPQYPFCEIPDGTDLSNVDGDQPGLWRCAPTMNITMNNKVRIGTITSQPGEPGAPHLFGWALFSFKKGLPSDWLSAVNWMHDQWLLGKKVIYPSWVTVE